MKFSRKISFRSNEAYLEDYDPSRYKSKSDYYRSRIAKFSALEQECDQLRNLLEKSYHNSDKLRGRLFLYSLISLGVGILIGFLF